MPDARELCAVSTGDPNTDRFDVLIHALAQLPDSMTLRLCGVRDRPGLEILARAYGIEDRLSFGDRSNGSSIVLTYAQNTNGGPGRTDDAVPYDPEGDPLVASDGLTLAELLDQLADSEPASLHTDRDKTLAGARVGVITNLPAPYRMPLFSDVAGRLRDVGAAFRVFFLAAAESDRPWISQGADPDFEFETLRSIRITRGKRPKLLPVDLELALRRFDPTIVVCGGLSPSVALRAAVVARARHAAFGVWSGDHRAMPTTRGRVRARARRLVARQATFGLAYGSLSAEYLRDLNRGLPTVLARNTSALAGEPRRRGDAEPTVRLLAVGDLATRRKGIDILLDALQLVPDLPCRLTVVGSGSLLDELNARSENDPRVRFVGALRPEQMAAAYAEADVFLFPSRQDVFGLALVEAMQAGLAPVAATAPGATADVCAHERNCLLVRDHSADAWAAAISRTVTDGNLRNRLAVGARRTIQARWTNEHSADAFLGGLRLGRLIQEAAA